MPRTCVFCGARADSKEHVFPNWLNGVFDQIPTLDKSGGAWERGSLVFGTGVHQHQDWLVRDIASVTTRYVCRGCNGGWMSTLEVRARPLLAPMILGKPHPLSMAQQLTVATWATKTAIVCERSLSTPSRTFNPDQCAIVREHDQPPGLLRIYAACIEGQITPLRYAKVVVSAASRETGIPDFDINLYTLQIGTLVIQVLRPDPPPPTYSSLHALPSPGDFDIQIFPPVNEFFWPPKRSLSPESLGAYSARVQKNGGY